MTASPSPSTVARVIANSTKTLHANEAVAPSETSVSMFGARCSRLLNPLMKNRWLMTMISPVSISCTRPMATWLSSNQWGRGQPHIICPIVRYISGISRHREAMSRFFSSGVSRSFRASSSGETALPALSRCFSDAP